jgi:hypothetical protein
MQEVFVDGEYEYDYEEVNGVHTLYYNNCEHWHSHIKGTIALQLINDGNGLKFGEEKLKKRIDYSQSLYLTILLKLINADYKFEISNKVTF